MHLLRVVIDLDDGERKLVPLALFCDDIDTRIVMARTIGLSALSRVGLEILERYIASGRIVLKPQARFSLSLDLEKIQ